MSVVVPGDEAQQLLDDVANPQNANKPASSRYLPLLTYPKEVFKTDSDEWKNLKRGLSGGGYTLTKLQSIDLDNCKYSAKPDDWNPSDPKALLQSIEVNTTNIKGFEYVAFGDQGLSARNGCMHSCCFWTAYCVCNDALAGCCGPYCPCVNQYHCTYQHYPDCGCAEDIYSKKAEEAAKMPISQMARTGHNFDSTPKKDSTPSLELFKFFEFSRKLAEMSYETSYKQLLVGDKASPKQTQPPLYTRAERAYADKFLPGKVIDGTMTVWQAHTTVAITCECLVPKDDGSGEERKLAVIFQGTGAQASGGIGFSLTDVWYDSISSHTTDFWASNGKKIGRVGMGFYLSYNMLRRQDGTGRSLAAYTEGSPGDLPKSIPGGGDYNSGGMIEYINSWAKKNSRSDVYIVGHSLGGSMAQICAADLALGSGFKNITLVTFGSPRAVGNRIALNPKFLQAVTHFRIVNALDPVPQHPIYGTEDPRGLTASLNTGYNNFNLAYHRCNQPPNAGNYYCCVGATDYEDPYYGKVSRKFERKKEAILKESGLFGGQKAARLLAALEARKPLDVNEGKPLSITRHFGRVFYADPIPGVRPGIVPVVWREMDFDDFHGNNYKLKRVMKDKTAEYDGVVRKKDEYDDPKWKASKCYGCCVVTVDIDPDDNDERYFVTKDVCGGLFCNSTAKKPIAITVDTELTKTQTCGEKCGVCCIRVLEESVDYFLDMIEFMNECPMKCRICNYFIPCCFTIRQQIKRTCHTTTWALQCLCISTLRIFYMCKPPSFPGGAPHLREALSHSLGDSIEYTEFFYKTPAVIQQVASVGVKGYGATKPAPKDVSPPLSTEEMVLLRYLEEWLLLKVKRLSWLTMSATVPPVPTTRYDTQGARDLALVLVQNRAKNPITRESFKDGFKWLPALLAKEEPYKSKGVDSKGEPAAGSQAWQDIQDIVFGVQSNYTGYTTLGFYADEKTNLHSKVYKSGLAAETATIISPLMAADDARNKRFADGLGFEIATALTKIATETTSTDGSAPASQQMKRD